MKSKLKIGMSDRLKRPPPGHETLERLKRWPGLKRRIMEDSVMIWCGEHQGYWRENGTGYVRRGPTGILQAWVLPLADALRKTRHCGPEKQIEFHSLF